jgi:heat shock protein HslJ
MKYIKLSIILIAVASLTTLAFTTNSETSKESSFSANSTINKTLLLKKWKLSHYEVFGERATPEANEKNDFIQFKKDGTFSGISEGKKDSGKYSLSNSSIVLSKNGGKGKLKMNVKKLSKSSLVVVLDLPEDPDAKYLDIHFKL